MKIEFYQNGNIKNIYLPNLFPLEHFSFIKEIIRLLIPKISKNLYIDSIEDELNKITEINKNEENYTNNNISYENETFNFNDEETQRKYLRNLNTIQKFNYIKRKVNSNNTIYNSNNSNNSNYNNSEISYICEDYVTQQLSKSIDFDLREVNIINDSINDNYTDTNNDNDANKQNNSYFSNLTELSIRSVETDEIKIEGGLVNTTIYSIIDDKGFLESVNEICISLMKSPEEEEEKGEEENSELDEDMQLLYNQIYNNDNQISLEQALESDKEGIQKNNVSFGISKFYTNSSYIINCLEHFINEEINKKLYKYFDNFKYELYVEQNNKTTNEKNDNLIRNLDDQNIVLANYFRSLK